MQNSGVWDNPKRTRIFMNGPIGIPRDFAPYDIVWPSANTPMNKDKSFVDYNKMKPQEYSIMDCVAEKRKLDVEY